jgi:hypothetical protein
MNSNPKTDLHTYLRGARETLRWKVEGLGEYDIRRPLTPTGTNLLGLIKHNTASQILYFGSVFDRRHDLQLPWSEAGWEPNVDMWATAEESRVDILALHQRSSELADTTVGELELDSVGRVPWWGDEPVTLHRVLLHVIADAQRHAGHADILREQIDGTAGLLQEADNLPHGDTAWWRDHWDRVEAAARVASER